MDNRFSSEPIFQLQVDEEVKANFLETSRWAKFIAIIGYIGLGIFVIIGLFVGFGMGLSNNPLIDNAYASTGIMAVYCAMAILYFFPTYYLYKYSTLLKSSLSTENQENFAKAISYQRRMFKFIGIMMIVLLCFYALLIIAMIAKQIFV